MQHLMLIPTGAFLNARHRHGENNKFWQGCGEKGNRLALLVGMQTGAAALENSVEVPQKIKNRITL